MKRIAVISVRFQFAENTIVKFGDTLAVKLDCCICRRCWRTVIFEGEKAAGRCTPTGHTFPGCIIAKQVAREGPVQSVMYRVAYHYETFVDVKHPDRVPTEKPTWGRVKFEIVCPQCGLLHQESTQNNLVRPWTHRCNCGMVLYTEKDEMPELL